MKTKIIGDYDNGNNRTREIINKQSVGKYKVRLL